MNRTINKGGFLLIVKGFEGKNMDLRKYKAYIINKKIMVLLY